MRQLLSRKRACALIAASLFAMPLSAWSASHTINVGQNSSGLPANAFNPSVVNATVGDTIVFQNVGASPGFHNARSDGPTQTFRCANGCDGAGGNGAPSSTNWSSTITLTTAGTIQFYCEIHGAPGAGMSGTINVTLPVELQSFEVD